MFRRAIGEATGWRLKSNGRQLYRELSRVYDDGDRIFLFGFSRGAITVRTLAGMIGMCGVLKGESFATAQALRAAVDEVYDHELFRGHASVDDMASALGFVTAVVLARRADSRGAEAGAPAGAGRQDEYVGH